MVDFNERATQSGHGAIDGAAASNDGESEGEAGHEHGHDDRRDHDHEGRHEHGGDGGHHHDHEARHDHAGHHSHDVETLGAAVVTVTSTRTFEDDPAGEAIVAAFESAGHEIATRELVEDDLDGVQGRVDSLVGREDVDVVVTTGGTGVTPDDVTVEALRPLFEKTLPGFGELFRRRSVPEIGSRVVATRATAGIADGVPVFCLPGSEAAAELGASEIIVPEAGHLAGLAAREGPE